MQLDYERNINRLFFIQEVIELCLVIKKVSDFRPHICLLSLCHGKRLSFFLHVNFPIFALYFCSLKGKISKSSQLENLDKKLLYSLNILSDSSRARAIEGFPALYDERLVRDGFHGFWLKTKSFASAIGAVSIEIRSFGNLDYFTV